MSKIVLKCGCYYDSSIKKMDKWVRCSTAKKLLEISRKSNNFKDRINYDNHFKKS